MKKAIASVIAIAALAAAPTAYASMVSAQIIDAQIAVIRLNMNNANAWMTASQKQTIICNMAKASRGAVSFYPLPAGC